MVNDDDGMPDLEMFEDGKGDGDDEEEDMEASEDADDEVDELEELDEGAREELLESTSVVRETVSKVRLQFTTCCLI